MADPSRVEIDTSLPFRSVRDAVSMFGEANGRKLRSPEKRIGREGDVQKAFEELARAKEQLKHADESKAEALSELADARKLLEEMNQNLKYANASDEEFKHGQEEENLIIYDLKETSKQPTNRIAFLGSNDVGEWSWPLQDLHISKERLAVAEQLEIRLAETTDALEVIRAELNAAKEAEERIARVAAEAQANFEQARSELERVRFSEGTSETMLSSELQKAKIDVMNGLNSANSLKIAMVSLQDELQLLRKEMVDLRDREAYATAAAAALASELNKAKAELARVLAAAAEANANEVMCALSQALQRATIEVEEANLETNAMREDARKARRDAEELKAALETAENKWKAAMQEATAAKEAESIALERVGMSEVESHASSTVFQDDSDALQRKLEEVERLASMRVAAALAQLEVVRASEQEIQQRLRNSEEDGDEMRKALKLALHKVYIAEAAKSAAEEDLRRLREKEQRRKERRLISYIQQEQTDEANDQSFPFETKHITSLGKVLNISIPHTDEAVAKKKKMNFLPSFGHTLVKK